jgi:hypothetical protein
MPALARVIELVHYASDEVTRLQPGESGGDAGWLAELLVN